MLPTHERKKGKQHKPEGVFLSIGPSFQTTNSLLVEFDKCSVNRRTQRGFLSEMWWEFHFPCVEESYLCGGRKHVVEWHHYSSKSDFQFLYLSNFKWLKKSPFCRSEYEPSHSWPNKENISLNPTGSIETKDVLLKMCSDFAAELWFSWTVKHQEQPPFCGDLMVIYFYGD